MDDLTLTHFPVPPFQFDLVSGGVGEVEKFSFLKGRRHPWQCGLENLCTNCGTAVILIFNFDGIS